MYRRLFGRAGLLSLFHMLFEEIHSVAEAGADDDGGVCDCKGRRK